MSVEIYRLFLFFHGSVFRCLFQTAWNHSSNNWNIAKVKFCDLFLIMWWTFDNIKHLIVYTREERKFDFSCHIWHFMCYVGLTCPQDHCLFDWTHCVVSLNPSYFPIHSIQEISVLEGVIMEIYSCLLDAFPVLA